MEFFVVSLLLARGVKRPTGCKGSRSGFSLLEIFVVLAIIGLLLAILLPAVQQVRSSARRLQCEQNLHQIAIAAHAYHELHGVLPVGLLPFRLLLPQLEQQNLAQELAAGRLAEFNVQVYLCPSDPKGVASLGHCNYLLNEGNGELKFDSSTSSFLQNGVRPSHNLNRTPWTRFADIVDGASSTALMSERRVAPTGIVADDEARRDPISTRWYLDRHYNLPVEHAGLRSACFALEPATATSLPRYPVGIAEYLQNSYGYNHLITPNRPGCYNAAAGQMSPADAFMGAIPATSRHAGGVNVAFADGHVQFVSDNIAMEVWDAIGTRNGGEAVGDF